MPPKPTTSDKFGASSLTLLGLVLVAASVWAAMTFLTRRLGVPGGYWLVPIFGALGGIVGGILRLDRDYRAENKLELCSFDDASKVNLGIVGDVVIGLGGASALAFLFGGTLLKFDPNEPQSLVLLVSASLIGGAYGRKIVEIAGEKLLRKAREEARQVAKEESRNLVGPPAAIAYTRAATEMIDSGDSLKALEILKTALENDPRAAAALVEQGRALKRLGRMEEALSSLEKALEIDPDKAEAFYNRACYNALLGRKGGVASDLKKAFALRPKLRELAAKDHDLDGVRNDLEIKEILENPGTGNAHQS
jgi:tetratricopeptide (TPR) repeat protein